MQKLVKGFHQFRREYFATHRELFEQLATVGQQPETLFITCADSRVVPNLITSTDPGELFTVRNAGNVVPPPGLPGGTLASIEYAVEVLGVESIIVCGHTQCGAMKAILDPATVKHLPYLSRWVQQAEALPRIIQERYGDLTPEMQLQAAVEENVLLQIENLRLHSFVQRKLDEGKIKLSGWVFDISTGRLFDFDPVAGQFAALIPPANASAPAV